MENSKDTTKEINFERISDRNKRVLACDKCKRLIEHSSVCPNCGSRAMHPVENDEPVYLTSREFIWVQDLRDLLEEKGIQCFTRGIFGAGLTSQLGAYTESYEIFVRFSSYQDALTALNDESDAPVVN